MTGTEKLNNTKILLEAGTNEMEIVEFSISGNIYGINVAKVREIIKYPENVIPVPELHPAVEGVVNLRGKVTPIINLPKYLGSCAEIDKSKAYVIVSEFNQNTIGFCVDAVDTIRRLSWAQIEPPSGAVAAEDGVVVAIVKFDDRMVLLLDFEKITAYISPDSSMQGKADIAIEEAPELDRSTKTILVAEDSKYILKIIVNTLQGAGYKIHTATDGMVAWEYLDSLVNQEGFSSITDHIDLVITDIEMPQMDGLSLIKNIKNHNSLRALPCLVFSSLINREMATKCKSVGADGQISKPEIGSLVELVDKFIM
jgi:two-component system chemotaxis response regulator CheV